MTSFAGELERKNVVNGPVPRAFDPEKTKSFIREAR